MREHGVLRRLLLVYEEVLRRLEHRGEARAEPFPRARSVIGGALGIVERFVEGYHEKMEEDFIFPRFERAGVHLELVRVLRQQHQAGRRVTKALLGMGAGLGGRSASDREQLARGLQASIRMYRPHAAQEDTILFPDFRSLLSEAEYARIGSAFEESEHKIFGRSGFEGIVAEVAQIERELGIDDLATFTARVPRR